MSGADTGMRQYRHLWAGLLAARRGAEELASWKAQRPGRAYDPQTNEICDRTAERAILNEIDRQFPEHNVISEESNPEFATKPRWIVDPLDGRTNYLNDIPHYSVSIAFEGASAADISVVYHIPSELLFTAVEGEGAYVNGRRMSVSETTELSDALVVTGFDPVTMESQNLEQFRSLIDQTGGVRRYGSAAAELAMVANGQFDVFFERVLSVWDTAAGTQIVEEAGGAVTRIEYFDEDNSEVVLASNPEIHQDVIALLSTTGSI